MTGIETFIILVIMVSWIIILSTFARKQLDKKIEGPKEKRCPAHKWEWEQQIGVEPPVYYIRCQWCRRLPGWEK